MITVSKEDYLKAILEAECEGEQVIAARLAQWLSVSAPAVTMALRRLKRDRLVSVRQDGRVQLTAEGRKIARQLVTRHHLIERMLHEVFGMDVVQGPRRSRAPRARRFRRLRGYAGARSSAAVAPALMATPPFLSNRRPSASVVCFRFSEPSPTPLRRGKHLRARPQAAGVPRERKSIRPGAMLKISVPQLRRHPLPGRRRQSHRPGRAGSRKSLGQPAPSSNPYFYVNIS